MSDYLFLNPALIWCPTTVFCIADSVETVSTKSPDGIMSKDTKLGRGVKDSKLVLLVNNL